MTNTDLTLLEIIRITIKWRKPIIIATLIALTASVTVALLLPNEYKSVSNFYAASSQAADTKTLFSGNADGSEIFGTDNDIDRLLSIGNSSKLAFHIIHKFDLYTDYDIDSTETPYHREYILKEFNSNYQLQKNDLGALEVIVYDKDKQQACDMVNEIVAQIDLINQKILVENNSKNLSVFTKRYNEKLTLFNHLNDSINNIRKQYGIFDAKTQAELLSEETSTTSNDLAMNKAKLKILEKRYNDKDTIIVNLRATISGLEERQKNFSKLATNDFNKGAGIVTSLENEIDQKATELAYAEELLQQVKLATSNISSTIFIIEKAEPAPRKSKPIRWLIVVASMGITFILSLLFAVIIETYGATLAQYLKNE